MEDQKKKVKEKKKAPDAATRLEEPWRGETMWVKLGTGGSKGLARALLRSREGGQWGGGRERDCPQWPPEGATRPGKHS